MIIVRTNIFETNSSSTHTLTIVPKKIWDKVKTNDLGFDPQSAKIKPHESGDVYKINELEGDLITEITPDGKYVAVSYYSED